MNTLYYSDNLNVLRQRVAVFVFSNRSFTKTLAAEIALLFFIISAHGQNVSRKDCDLGLAASPALRGMKLGMSVTEIEKVLGIKLVVRSSKSRPFQYENDDKDLQAQIRKLEIEDVDQSTHFPLSYLFRKKKRTVGLFPEYEEVPKIDGVSALRLRFYKNSLYSINIQYDQKDLDWKDSREFALILSEKFKIPAEFWSTVDVRSTSLILDEPYEDESTMFCRDFILSVQAKGIDSKISIFDLKTFKVVQEKTKEKTKQAIEREVKRIKDAEAEEKTKQAIEREVKQIKDLDKKRKIRP